MESVVIRVNTGYYFLAIYQFKINGTLPINHLSYIAIIYKAMLFFLAKSQAESQGPWAASTVGLISKCFYQKFRGQLDLSLPSLPGLSDVNGL